MQSGRPTLTGEASPACPVAGCANPATDHVPAAAGCWPSLRFVRSGLLATTLLIPAHAAEITLAWDQNPETTLGGYRLYTKQSGGSYGAGVDVGKVTQRTVTGLQDGQTYSFRVTAYAGAVESAPSNEVTATIPGPAPLPYTCPCTIWPASATPLNPADQDQAAVELGVKFRSDVPGYVTGIRFYKSQYNAGPHYGSLWKSSGTRLARAQFTNETASGWQQVNFPTPIAINANTTYIASYHAPRGRYAGDNGGLATVIYRAPLKALANGGVYKYGSGGFPNSTYQSSNYWVDIVFKPK